MGQRVAVIGGGPAGCAAAFELAQRGHDVTLFEQAAAVGGRTTSWRSSDGASVLDTGAGFFTSFYPVMQGLLSRCKMLDQRVEMMRSTLLVYQDREAPLSGDSLRSFLRFPFVSRRERLRMARHGAYCMLRYRNLQLADAASLAPYDDMSAATYARRVLGGPLYDYLIRPSIEPFWYFSAEDASRALLCALLARAATARFYTLKGGMDTLCHALVAQVHCLTGTAVQHLEVTHGQVRVHTEAGTEAFHGVVVATPATAAQRLTRTGLSLPPVLRTFLQTQHYVPNVHVAFTVPRGAFAREASSIFPCGPGSSDIAAVSINNRKNQCDTSAETELISIFLSAAASATCLAWPADAIAQHVWRAARSFYPGLPAAAPVHSLHLRQEAIPVHAVGRYRLAAQCLQSQGPPVVFAGDYLATATVDGALFTGLKAAQTLSAAWLGRSGTAPLLTAGRQAQAS